MKKKITSVLMTTVALFFCPILISVIGVLFCNFDFQTVVAVFFPFVFFYGIGFLVLLAMSR